MGTTEVVDLSIDNEGGQSSPRALAVELESDFAGNAKQQIKNSKGRLAKPQSSQNYFIRHDSEENLSSNGPSTGHGSSSVLDQGLSTVDDAEFSSSSSIHAAPICRQFWKAGNYDDELRSKVKVQSNLTSIF